jgi:hypothetical protein
VSGPQRRSDAVKNKQKKPFLAPAMNRNPVGHSLRENEDEGLPDLKYDKKGSIYVNTLKFICVLRPYGNTVS